MPFDDFLGHCRFRAVNGAAEVSACDGRQVVRQFVKVVVRAASQFPTPRACCCFPVDKETYFTALGRNITVSEKYLRLLEMKPLNRSSGNSEPITTSGTSPYTRNMKLIGQRERSLWVQISLFVRPTFFSFCFFMTHAGYLGWPLLTICTLTRKGVFPRKEVPFGGWDVKHYMLGVRKIPKPQLWVSNRHFKPNLPNFSIAIPHKRQFGLTQNLKWNKMAVVRDFRSRRQIQYDGRRRKSILEIAISLQRHVH